MNDFYIDVIKVIVIICAWEFGRWVPRYIKKRQMEKYFGAKIGTIEDLPEEVLMAIKKTIDKENCKDAEADTAKED